MRFGFMGSGMIDLFSMLIFVVVIGVFVVSLVKGIGQWHKNNQSPQLTVEATVVTKRVDVTHHHHNDGNVHHHHVSSSSSYYATFQVLSGDRMEFRVSGREYGLLVEGDTGALTFQGTRYLRFDRYEENHYA